MPPPCYSLPSDWGAIMRGNGQLCRLLFVGWALAAVPLGAQTIFLDDFDDGTACAWKVTGPDLCGLFMHSSTQLYRLDVAALTPILVGPFNTGGPSILDIAIDKNDAMFGVSSAKLWSIDRATGAASEIGAFNGGPDALTSLSFVPLDAADPASAERLVTAGDSGSVYEVDPATGATTLLGNYGTSSGQQIRSAGDLVSIRGLGTFALVTIGDTPSASDFLATIDTTTWLATPIGTLSTGFDKVFGLGYQGGTMHGFVDNGAGAGTGSRIEIDLATGVGALADTSAIRWLGAGAATDPLLGP